MRILLVVDAQNDFMPGGALPVPGGDEIVPVINSIRDKFDTVIWTKDWHPNGHCSFVGSGGPWPTHCVQNTTGAELHKDLIIKSRPVESKDDRIIVKGIDYAIDSYSGFYDNERKKATELVALLRAIAADGPNPKLYVCGLATNFCVLFTVMDALKEGYETFLITDACRGIDNALPYLPGAVEKSVKQMMDAGAALVSSTGILNKGSFTFPGI